ncbi:MAG: hypothetical protein V1928_02605 [Parcubacteria group bacterium]
MLEKIDQKKSPRPTNEDLREKKRYYEELETEEQGSGQFMIDEIKNYIDAKGDDETKEQFYPGWTKQDFEDLLEMLESR